MKKKQPDQSIYTRREYKHDRAMLEAIKRSAWHPKPVSMVSNVPEFNKLATNK